MISLAPSVESRRRALEIRTVVVSYRAAARALNDEFAREYARSRARLLLHEIALRLDPVADDPLLPVLRAAHEEVAAG